MDDLSINERKILKNGGNMKIFLESCKERSKLSVDGFGSLRDHLVSQKSNFKIFSSKMTLTSDGPCLPTCVISKLSGNVFWDRWDHLVAQKSKKCDFFNAQMTLTHEYPPAYLPA